MTDQPRERIKMTVEEYQALPESMQRMELINGELIIHEYEGDTMSPSPYDNHQRIITSMIILIGKLISGGELRAAPLDIYVDGVNALQPDVLWISPENTSCQLKGNYWYGAPDLVVEVLSKSTAQRDREEKYAIYERNGVREYWIVDGANLTLEVFVLTEGAYQRQGVYSTHDTFESPVLDGGKVEMKAIFGG